MNSKSNFSISSWANGKPSIGIYPYSHSPRGFESILDRLAQHFDFIRPKADIIGPEAIPELHNYWAEIKIDGEEVIVAMDEFTCSIACDSNALRDKIFRVLQSVK